MTKKIILCITLLMFFFSFLRANEPPRPFKGYLYNSDYEVYLRLNLYDEDIIIPGQELFGQLPGYLSKEHTTYCWLIVSSELTDNRSAQLVVTNDYGSEDFTAQLTQQNDSTYIFNNLGGSALKVPNKGKWLKLPKTLIFKKK